MPDREKVIAALKNCIDEPKCRDCPWDECEGEHEHVEMPRGLVETVAELLTEQEETRLVHHYSRPNVYADLWYHCEKCGGKFDDNWKPKYCPGCGRRVKWDAENEA